MKLNKFVLENNSIYKTSDINHHPAFIAEMIDGRARLIIYSTVENIKYLSLDFENKHLPDGMEVIIDNPLLRTLLLPDVTWSTNELTTIRELFDIEDSLHWEAQRVLCRSFMGMGYEYEMNVYTDKTFIHVCDGRVNDVCSTAINTYIHLVDTLKNKHGKETTVEQLPTVVSSRLLKVFGVEKDTPILVTHIRDGVKKAKFLVSIKECGYADMLLFLTIDRRGKIKVFEHK